MFDSQRLVEIRKIPGLRVLNSYWVAQESNDEFSVLLEGSMKLLLW